MTRRDHVSASDLKEGIDYTVDELGRYVFTAAFLLRRGTCCGSKCRNCPYGWANVPEPKPRAPDRKLDRDLDRKLEGGSPCRQ